MTRGDAVNRLRISSESISNIRGLGKTYSELLDVVHADFISAEVDKGVLQHAGMAVTEIISKFPY